MTTIFTSLLSTRAKYQTPAPNQRLATLHSRITESNAVKILNDKMKASNNELSEETIKLLSLFPMLNLFFQAIIDHASLTLVLSSIWYFSKYKNVL